MITFLNGAEVCVFLNSTLAKSVGLNKWRFGCLISLNIALNGRVMLGYISFRVVRITTVDVFTSGLIKIWSKQFWCRVAIMCPGRNP